MAHLLPTLIEFNLILIQLKRPSFDQTFLAVGYSTEVAMAVMQIRRLFPLRSTSGTALWCVVVFVSVNRLRNEEDGL